MALFSLCTPVARTVASVRRGHKHAMTLAERSDRAPGSRSAVHRCDELINSFSSLNGSRALVVCSAVSPLSSARPSRSVPFALSSARLAAHAWSR